MLFSKYHKVQKGEYLYKKGDQNGRGFFFILTGRVEILVAPINNNQIDNQSEP